MGAGLVTVLLLLLATSVQHVTPLWPTLEDKLQACESNGPLGLISGVIEDWQITASSTYPNNWDQGCHERYARVYQPNGVAWCAKTKSASEWLQIDLGVPAKVTGLMTQGRADGTEWVISYMLGYSLDAYHWAYVTDYYGNRRIFDGNTDSYHVKHAYLDEPIIARYVKFHIVQWNRHPSMRVEVIGCQVCMGPIALPPYGKVSASSTRHSAKSSQCQPDDGFIVTQKGWCSKEDNGNQWLQFDVGPPSIITGVVTRGRGDPGRRQWVTRYLISYSNDSSVWYFYKDAGQLDVKEFGGNVDRDTERYHYFNSPFMARYVRFHPVEWFNHISMRAGLVGCPQRGDCGPGFLRVVPSAPCVENVAFKKDSFINNKRQYKRHIRNMWTRGHASRAVDGDVTGGLHSCTVLDNFYVDKPTWMVDLGQRIRVSGIKIVTWQGKEQGETRTRDYMLNLDRITVYVDSVRGGVGLDRRKRTQQRGSRAADVDDAAAVGVVQNPVVDAASLPDAPVSLPEVVDEQADSASTAEDDGGAAAGGQSRNICGYVSRFNDAVFRPELHVQCSKPLMGRYVYIEATGVAARTTRQFSAVLCEVMVYV